MPRNFPTHQPGQFVTVGVQINGVWQQRCFSITSPTSAPHLQITVQANGRGGVSDHLAHAACVGDTVRASEPCGDFVVPETARRLLFITAGSGMTPVVAMVRSLIVDRPTPAGLDVMWIHHARTTSTLLFAEELQRWDRDLGWLDLDLRLTGHGSDRVDLERLDHTVADWRERTTLVCGPSGLLESASDHWANAKLDNHLTIESFQPNLMPGGAVADGALPSKAPSTVLAARSDRVFDGLAAPTLLDAAEAAGLAPSFGCRMGICHTCTTRLDSGCVTDLRDGRVLDAGSHVQLCVTAPRGDVTLDL